MELGFRDVETLLLSRHGVADERRIALRGRLEHLRKLGCPPGVQTGKGRPAVFGWKQLVELAVALDLINLGITPEHASRVIRDANDTLVHAITSLNVALSKRSLVDAVRQEKCPFSRSIFLTVQVGALDSLGADGALKSPTVGLLNGAALMDNLRSAGWTDTATVLIDVGTLVAALISLVGIWSQHQVPEAVEDFRTWAAEYGLRP